MSWKESLAELDRRMDMMIRHLGTLQAAVMNHSKEVRLLRETVAKGNKSADRMADRLIEMAMVNKGMGRDAAIHRRSLQDEAPLEQQDLWQESPEEEWPPKGFDAINMP